jgi:hypothetical protein
MHKHIDMKSFVRLVNIFASAELSKIFPLPKTARYTKVTFVITNTWPGLSPYSNEMYFYVLTDSNCSDVTITKNVTNEEDIIFTFSKDFDKLFDYLEPVFSSNVSSINSDFNDKEYFGRVYCDDISIDSCNYQRSTFFDNFLSDISPKTLAKFDFDSDSNYPDEKTNDETENKNDINDESKIVITSCDCNHSDHFSYCDNDNQDRDKSISTTNKNTKNDKNSGLINWISTVAGLSLLSAATVFGLFKLRNK